ncbi:MAG: hypothetical protein EAY75_05590 [Bacteroidetes bacterium]|nr:MAG: hypothetical protein EAY75_05590 [Bacteroidota bacterium]
MANKKAFCTNRISAVFTKTLIASILVAASLTGCSNLKPTDMFRSYLDSSYTALPNLAIQEANIEPGDRLEITFAGRSVEVTAALNNYGVSKAESPTSMGKVSGSSGIEVDKDGLIELPLIGKLKVAGKTRSELKLLLTAEAAKYLVDPIVYLGNLSKKITVLGEVRNPNTQKYEEAKVSIFEALSNSGNVTDFAIMEKVVVYRDVNGKREIGNINLTDSSMFTSPYFYLRNHDMVYVPTQSEKMRITQRNQALPLISMGLGLVGLLVGLVTLLR